MRPTNQPRVRAALTYFAAMVTMDALGASSVQAVDFIWDGELNPNWNTTSGALPNRTSNWSPDIGQASNPVPDANDTVTFPGTANGFVVFLNGDREVVSAAFDSSTGYLIGNVITPRTLTIGSGDITASGNATHEFGPNAAIALGADATWDVASDTTLQVSSNISGNFTLTKTGDGVLSLSANNDYAETIVQGGVLRIGNVNRLGAVGADLTLENGGELQATFGFSSGVSRELIVQAGGGVFNTGNHNVTWHGVVSGSGTFEKTGTGILTLTNQNSHTGTTTISQGALQLGHANGLETSVVNILDDGGLILSNNSTIRSLTGSGDISLGSHTLTIDGGGSIDTVPRTYSGVISGTGNLIISRIQRLRLTEASTFSGTTTIDTSLVIPENSNALQNSTIDLVTNFGLSLDFFSSAGQVNIGALSGTGDLEIGLSVTLTTGSNNASTTYAGQITGIGQLVKTGTGTMTLTRNNLHSGGTTINDGTLALEASGGAGTGVITVTGPGTIAYADGVDVTNSIDLQDDLTVQVDAGSAVQRGLIDDAFGSSHGITKIGSGELVLSVIHDYGGTTTISGGTIRLFNPNVLKNSTVDIQVNDGLDIVTSTSNTVLGGLAGTGDLNIGSTTLTVGENGDFTTYSGQLRGSGRLIVVGGGFLRLDAANTHTGGTLLQQGPLILGHSEAAGPGTITVAPEDTLAPTGLVYANGIDVANTIDLQGEAFLQVSFGEATQSGVIENSMSSTGFTKTGGGRLLLNAANTYSGGTTLNQGRLILGDSAAVGTGTIRVEGGSIEYGDGIDVANGIDLGHDLTLIVEAGQTATQSGPIAQTQGSFGITKKGAGTLILSAGSNYSGTTTIENGVLVVQNALGSPGDTVLVKGNTLQASGAVLRQITGNGNGTVEAIGPLIVGELDNALGYTFSGILDVGNHEVILLSADRALLGSSTLLAAGGVLNAVNGSEMTSGKTLTATGSAMIEGDFTNNGTVNGPIGAGELLSFDDDVDGAGDFTGNVAFLQGFNPGNSPAAVNFAGNMTLGPNATLQIELGGTAAGTQHDQINVTPGTATLDGTLDVTLINGFNPNHGDLFAILTAGSTAVDFDQFTGDIFNIGDNKALVPVWLERIADGAEVLALVVTAPGDANLDGRVTLADFAILQNNFNLTGQTWTDGNFNPSVDDQVSFADFALMQNNFDTTFFDPAAVFDGFNVLPLEGSLAASAATALVPEPGTLGMLSIGALMAMRPTRRSLSSSNT